MPEQPDTAADAFDDDDLTDSVPLIQPVYADATYRQLGQRLAALYFARDTDSGTDAEARTEAIAKVAAQMRRGPRLHAGEFLADGRYRLIESMSKGGPNGHWKAWDRDTGGFVFLTVFHDAWADDGAEVKRFHARGQRLVRLDHPHIGKVHDAEQSQEGWVYVAQDFYPAGNLRGLAVQPGFDAIAALQVLVETAEGLRHAHDAGVVHSDVRPENLMLSEDAAAHLVDFVVGPSGKAGWGSLYAAPETAEKGYEAQPAADVYGLGMTALFALNKGDLPVWVLRDPGRLIDAVQAPEHVKRVVAKATEWDLNRRYPDVRTLLRELMSDPELVRILADRALENGRLDVGAGHFEKLLKTQPHRGVEYRTILGEVYTRMGAYDQAHGHFAAALERTPDVRSLFPALRTVAERTGQWGRLAELLWTQARQRDAGRRVVLRAELAAINEHELDDAKSAREVWGQVLAEHRVPEQARNALRALMRLCEAAGDGEAFITYGQELLAYLPEGDEASAVEWAIGRTLIVDFDRVDEGLPWIDRAEAHGHSELALAPVLQQIRAERGQWRRVIRLMIAQARKQDISEASPTLLRAGIIAGSVHLEEEAFEVYHSLLERAPRHVVALRHLARMHHRARQPERALPFYERLWDTYRGRDTEEPEASERAADCMAYASILLRDGRADESMERLQEALRLTPFHVPSLQMAGPMFLARGEVDAAADVFDRLLRAFKSVERAPQKVDACLGMGDLAWIQGRVTPAMGWYNRALELEPFSVRAWWGLSKVALTARGGHEGVERAPWVKAVPKRFTTAEALARLLCSLLDPAAMVTWLSRTPLGAAMVAGGDAPMRLACAVAEVLIRNDLAGPELYQRLFDAFPAWHSPIETVRQLAAEGRTSTFPVHEAYGWTRGHLGDADFSPDVERTVLPPEPAPAAGTADALTGPAAWGDLFAGARSKPPQPKALIQEHEEPQPVVFEGPIGALVRDKAVWLQLNRDREVVRIGRRPGSDLRIVHDETVALDHGRMFRQGGRIYIEAFEGPIAVDGELRTLWRLVGGERVTVGETRLQYRAVDEPGQLPPRRREPPRVEDVDPEQTLPATSTTPAEIVALAAAEAAAATASAAPDAGDEFPRVSTADEEPELVDVVEDDFPEDDPSAVVEEQDERPVEPDSGDGSPEAAVAAEGDEEETAVHAVLPEAVLAAALAAQAAEGSAGTHDPGAAEGEESPHVVPEGEVHADGGAEEESGSDAADDDAADDDAADDDAADDDAADDDAADDDAADDDAADDDAADDDAADDDAADVDAAGDDAAGDDADDDDAGPSTAESLAAMENVVVTGVGEDPEFGLTEDDDGAILAMPSVSEEIPREEAEAMVAARAAEIAESAEGPEGASLQEEEETAYAGAESDSEAPHEPELSDEPELGDEGISHVDEPSDEVEDEDDEVIEQRLHSPEPGPMSPPVSDVPADPSEDLSVDAPPQVYEADPLSDEVVDAPPAPTLRGTPVIVDSPPPVRDPSEDEGAMEAPLPRPVPTIDDDASGSFGFPSEFADDDVDALQSEAPPIPKAVVAGGSAPPEAQPSPVDPSATGIAPAPESADDGPPHAVLEYMSGADRGAQAAIGAVLTVGQSKHCGMSIPGDTRLSPVHCKVERTSLGYKLVDEGSANGTVVNGARIHEVDLHGGEVIMVGRTVLRFRILEETT